MTRLIAAACGLAMLCVSYVAAEAKTVVLLRGMFGEFVAPMTDIAEDLTKRGHKVILGSHRAPPQVKADYVITHSAGDIAGLTQYPGAKVITIDPTFLNPGCAPDKACTNYYAAINRLPFFFCCGGYPVKGASNNDVGGTPSFIIFAPGHVSMPSRVKDRIVGSIK
jgi:hypothetical protein